MSSSRPVSYISAQRVNTRWNKPSPVEALRAVMGLIQSGALQGLSIVGTCRDGNVWTYWGTDIEEGSVFELLGGLELVKTRVLQQNYGYLWTGEQLPDGTMPPV